MYEPLSIMLNSFNNLPYNKAALVATIWIVGHLHQTLFPSVAHINKVIIMLPRITCISMSPRLASPPVRLITPQRVRVGCTAGGAARQCTGRGNDASSDNAPLWDDAEPGQGLLVTIWWVSGHHCDDFVVMTHYNAVVFAVFIWWLISHYYMVTFKKLRLVILHVLVLLYCYLVVITLFLY